MGAIEQELGKVMMRIPFLAPVPLRRDRHEPVTGGWLHHDSVCLSLE